MSQGWRITISFFIAFNILSALIAPIKPKDQRTFIQNLFYPYALWTRTLQEWGLFTPSPRTSVVFYKYEILFKDGQKKTWVRPYPEKWDFFQRHLAYNWQKFDLAGHNLDHPLLYDDVADYIKRLFWENENPPVEIKLFRSRAPWPAPKTEGYALPQIKELRWFNDLLFDYRVEENKFVGPYEKPT